MNGLYWQNEKGEKMIRRFMVLIICLLVFVGAVPQTAYGSSTFPDVRVAFFKLEGYNEINENGARSGYGYEMLQLISRYEQMSYEYKGHEASWAEVIDMLRRGDVDIVPSAQKTAALESEFAFSEKSVCSAATVLTVKKGNDEIVSGDFSTYDGKVFGLLEGNERNDSFREFAEKNEISYEEVMFKNITALRAALNSGKVDVAVTSSLISNQEGWVINYFDEVPLYIMMRKSDKNLKSRIDRALEKMEIEEPNWRVDLYEKYFPNYTDEMFYLTSDEHEMVDELNREGYVFKVLASPERYPYSYRDETGRITGIMFDVFETLAERIGIKYEILKPKNTAEYLKLLSSGEADICLDMTPDLYTAESYNYQITETYLTAPFSWVRRSDYFGSINRAAKVDVFYQTPAQYYFDNKKIALEYVILSTREECVEAVRSGIADGYCTYTYMAEKIIYENERGDLAVEFSPIEAEFTIGVSENIDHSFVSIMNKAVLSLDSAIIETSVREHIVLGEQPITLQRIIYQRPIFVAVIIIILFFITFLLVSSVLRVRRSRKMKDTIKEQTLRIRELMHGMLGVLATAIEYRDNDSGEHVQRISHYTGELMEALMQKYPQYDISPEDVDKIADASILHDIGKVAISDAILLKPGRLTDEEFEEMKLHTIKGCEILEKIPDVMEREVYRYAYDICRYHHERWDGRGYPDGLKGDEIPIWAQVAAIADVYDALTAERPYKRAFSHEKAVHMILDGDCGSFNPKLLEAFESVNARWAEVLKES